MQGDETAKPSDRSPERKLQVVSSVLRGELGWAATFLASPYGRFISGHTLVVDGANWLRRSMTSPPVVTVRDQLGRGPFEP